MLFPVTLAQLPVAPASPAPGLALLVSLHRDPARGPDTPILRTSLLQSTPISSLTSALCRAGH